MSMNGLPTATDIGYAAKVVSEILKETPCWHASKLSDIYGSTIFLKREDRQKVRSYKIRGAYNKMRSLSQETLSGGVACASAGNHAQGVAFSCSMMGVKGYIFMPEITPQQKIESVKYFGKDNVEIMLVGRTFDEAAAAAKSFCRDNSITFVPPFDDPYIIAGQGTVAYEMLAQMEEHGLIPDYVFVPIGGGGLASGVGTWLKAKSPATRLIGVEPEGAASMRAAFNAGRPVPLEEMDTFVDGAAVRCAGELTYKICREVLDDLITVPEGAVCTTMLEMYNRSGIVLEPAGALSITALRFYADAIRGCNVCSVISGGNSDVVRIADIQERSSAFESSR